MGDRSIDELDRGLGEAFYQGDAAGFADGFEGGAYSESWKLAEASGLTDIELVDRLVGLGIRASTLAALTLVPLIEVAWADDRMEAKERDAILAGAEATGLEKESPSYRLLEIWTLERPAPAVVTAWEEFVRQVQHDLEPGERQRFQDRLLAPAKAVAEAAGGFLGLTSKISAEERAVLERMERAVRG